MDYAHNKTEISVLFSFFSPWLGTYFTLRNASNGIYDVTYQLPPKLSRLQLVHPVVVAHLCIPERNSGPQHRRYSIPHPQNGHLGH